LTFALPPVGSASILSHTKHFTVELAFPNIICSFLHFGHLTFTNLLTGSFIPSMKIPPLKDCFSCIVKNLSGFLNLSKFFEADNKFFIG